MLQKINKLLILLLAVSGIPIVILFLPLILLFRFGNYRHGPKIAVAVSHRWPYYLQYLRLPYDFAVWRAGGTTLTVGPADITNLKQILSKADGIILTGGEDIDPQLHDGSLTAVDLFSSPRDELELEILYANEKLNLPLLCICRGAQLLTVYKGGKLECHDNHSEKLKRHSTSLFNLGRHSTKICRHSELHRILQRDEIEVISIHHHAASTVGKLKVSAFAIDDESIEAVECLNAYWTIGIQWHPELQAPFSKAHQAIFDALIQKAIAKKKS